MKNLFILLVIALSMVACRPTKSTEPTEEPLETVENVATSEATTANTGVVADVKAEDVVEPNIEDESNVEVVEEVVEEAPLCETIEAESDSESTDGCEIETVIDDIEQEAAIEPIALTTNKIYYTAVERTELCDAASFGANILSHDYDSSTGKGVITFDNNLTTIGDNAFSHCRTLTGIVIPEGVTSIGDGAFTECKLLADVAIPDSVTTIGNKAFSGCSYLVDIALPDSVATIGDGAFADCNSMHCITLPESITSIGSHAFEHCHTLSAVLCYATIPPTLGEDVFEDDSHDGRIINVPEDAVDDYRKSDSWLRYKYDIFKLCDRSEYHVGDLVTYNGAQGVVFQANDYIVKLISVTETTAEWGLYGTREGASDYEHGEANADIAKQLGCFESLPTFAWCEELGDGWYLPAFKELATIYSVRDEINRTLVDNGFVALANYYWSSTENLGSYYAYYFCFSDICQCDRGRKRSANHVRAVAAF